MFRTASRYLFFLFFLYSQWSYSQILNVDRILSDSMSKPWYFLNTGSFSQDKQKKNILDLSVYSEFVYRLSNEYGLIYIGQYDGAISSRSFLQNEGYFQFRYRDMDTRELSVESYIQYQWNGVWGLRDRRLFGANLRKELFAKRRYDGYAAIGGFYQSELWDYTGVEDEKLIPPFPIDITDVNLRGNVYLKLAGKISNSIDIALQNFIQYNVLHLHENPNLRWSSIAELTIDLNDHSQLTFAYDHMFNQHPVVPIKTYYYGFNTGFSFTF